MKTCSSDLGCTFILSLSLFSMSDIDARLQSACFTVKGPLNAGAAYTPAANNQPKWLTFSSYSYSKFRKRVIIPVLIRSANMAPMIGTMRKGLTV